MKGNTPKGFPITKKAKIDTAKYEINPALTPASMMINAIGKLQRVYRDSFNVGIIEAK